MCSYFVLTELAFLPLWGIHIGNTFQYLFYCCQQILFANVFISPLHLKNVFLLRKILDRRYFLSLLKNTICMTAIMNAPEIFRTGLPLLQNSVLQACCQHNSSQVYIKVFQNLRPEHAVHGYNVSSSIWWQSHSWHVERQMDGWMLMG